MRNVLCIVFAAACILPNIVGGETSVFPVGSTRGVGKQVSCSEATLGQFSQDGYRFIFKLNFLKASRRGLIKSDLSDIETQKVLVETVRILEKRLGSRAQVNAQKPNRIVIDVPECQESEVPQVCALVTQQGKLELRLVVDSSLPSFNIVEEHKRLNVWLKKKENQALIGPDCEEIAIFNALSPSGGGPARSGLIQWVPLDGGVQHYFFKELRTPILWNDALGKPVNGLARYIPVSLEALHFDYSDFKAESIELIEDDNGSPALRLEFKPEMIDIFTKFTSQNVGRTLAIIINGRVHSAPVITSQIVGHITLPSISKEFGMVGFKTLILALQGGSLRFPLELEEKSKIFIEKG